MTHREGSGIETVHVSVSLVIWIDFPDEDDAASVHDLHPLLCAGLRPFRLAGMTGFRRE